MCSTSTVVIVRFLLYFLFFLIDDRWGRRGEGRGDKQHVARIDE